MAWNTSFFWDGRATSLDDLLLDPVPNPIEMDLSWPEAEERIGSDSNYQSMFAEAFGTPCVDSMRITFALAQFIRTMISANSKFDQRLTGEYFLSPQEQNGLFLFQAEYLIRALDWVLEFRRVLFISFRNHII